MKFSIFERNKRQEMFFNKSLTFNEEEITSVALAANLTSAVSAVETQFIERLKAGDANAFDTLVTRYTSDIFGLLYRITEDAEEAGDLTQETFLSVFKAIKNFRGDADLKTWLFRIAINKSRNQFRWWKRRRREKTFSLDAPLSNSETPFHETISGTIANPEEKILQREREKVMMNALSDLPEIFREAVVLCDIEDLSYEEIASVLEINIGTVKSRIARGREELRKKLVDI